MDSNIRNLNDLDNFRSAPDLELDQKKNLLKEIDLKINIADWITVGIMAPADFIAKKSLNSLLKRYESLSFNSFENITAPGNVYLKGNQKTGNVFIRSENGLGEGILITCQYDNRDLESNTFGPLPLDFFIY